MKKDPAIEILRCLAICAVVVQHATFPERYSGNTMQFIMVTKEILGWCVLCFFSLSGYFTRLDQPLHTFIKRRFSRLIIPYVSVSAAAFVSLVVINKVGLYHTKDVMSLGNFVDQMWHLQGFGPQFYFLPYLFLMSTFVVVLSRWLSPLVLFVIAVAILGLQSFVFGPYATTGGYPTNVPIYLTAFLLGLLISSGRMTRQTIAVIVVVGTLVGLLQTILLHVVLVLHVFIPIWLYLGLKHLPGSARLGELLGKFSSGAVYLWHAPVLLPAASVLLLRFGVREVPNFVLCCVAAILGSLLVHRILVLLRIDRYFSL